MNQAFRRASQAVSRSRTSSRPLWLAHDGISSKLVIRSISTTCPAHMHPNDRLKAKRREALSKLGLPVEKEGGEKKQVSADISNKNDGNNNWSATASSKTLHPEERLKAARQKALQNMGFNADGNVTKEYGSGGAYEATSPTKLSLCAINGHPNHRLKLARERMAVKMGSLSVRIDAMSPDQRLAEARAQQAAQPLQTFTPMRRKRKKRQPRLSHLSSDQPNLPKNDGCSSGAVTASRLREARKEAIERLIASSSSDGSPPPH